jgi:D-sedoheptulose 7-phosphate isomerase
MRDLVCACARADGKLMFAGNGASASVSSHCAVDFTKQARVRAMSFNEANLITCYGNDYGYERWIERAVAHYADPGDLLVLIGLLVARLLTLLAHVVAHSGCHSTYDGGAQ